MPPEDARFPDAVSLEEATLSDHETVIGLIRDYYAYDEIPFLESAIAPGLRALLGGPEFGRVFLVKSGSDIAGYVIFTFGFDLEFGGRQATITDFFLRPNFRRLGLGTKAFRLLESQCAKLGVMALELQPERDNTEAYAFYRKMGFKALDRTPMSKRIVA